MQKLFNSIVSKGVKDNTYKFTLTKFLLDYAHENEESNIIWNVPYKLDNYDLLV